MGQSEILDLMRKHYDHWFNADELSKHFFVGKVSVNRCLVKLFKYKLVVRQKKRV
jgi:predicted transcriptional regulator